MSPLSEQFSAARTTQLETQFTFFRNVTGKAFDSAEKLIALHLDTSRVSLEQSALLVRQLIAAKDPRELFALTSQTRSPFDSVLAYSRQLMGIAASVAIPASASASAPAPACAPAPAEAAPAPEAVAAKVMVAKKAPAVKKEPVAEKAPSAEKDLFADKEPVVKNEPVVETAPVAKNALIAEPAPEAEPIAPPTLMVSAPGNFDAFKPGPASFPVRSSDQPIAVVPVTPVEATPPVAASGTPAGVATKAAAPATKAARKKQSA